MNYQLVRHKLLGFTKLAIDNIEPAAVSSSVVEPAWRQIVPPAIYFPSGLDRVTSSWEGTTIESEAEKLKGGPTEHAATIAYTLRNVTLAEGALYSGRWSQRLLIRDKALPEDGPSRHFDSGTLACTWSGNHFFGHWIADDLTLHLAAEDTGNPFTLKRSAYIHEPGYRDLFDIQSTPLAHAHFDEVTILQDFGQNRYKKRRYEILRDRIRQKIQPAGVKRVFLRRGNLGQSREIINAHEMETCLISSGYSIVELEKLSPAQIAEQTNGAEVVIGVEGSQMLHGFMNMAEGGVLCSLQPPARFNNPLKAFTDCLNMRYATLVGIPAPGGFRIDIPDLQRILEKIDFVLSHRGLPQ